ncbi:lytic transglycosylase [Halalkalibacillus sediminis]|uniref:Lytic transglycosylase n=1 Tax=Halalkalibacillus sediminis TaxID=2018042 RepID=A0A2I0QXD6_9BACI|nr:transglycosylase SLT domain-containing protein [Halalkalibacillus sediminis]PKR79006.1 lytic transglycosylase [Halalkalibacillus sediminis]
MNYKVISFIFLSLLLISGGVILNNSYYEEQLTQLEDEKEQINKTNDSLVDQNEYLRSKETVTQEGLTMEEWQELERNADQMVTNSDGNFKKSWALFLNKKAKEYEVDPFIVYELLRVETGNTFDPELTGPETKYGHAYGMSQFMENTAPWIAEMAGLPYEKELLFDPEYSIELSIVYLDFLHHKYDNWDEALTAYHRGMGGLEKYKANKGHAASWYAVEIQEEAEKRRQVAFAN